MQKSAPVAAAPSKAWQVVEELRTGLRDAFADDFRGLILYGSHARGDADQGSDVDVLVLFADAEASKAAGDTVREVAYDLLMAHGELVSATPMAEMDYRRGRSPFFLNVKREGILVLAEEALKMKPEIDQLMAKSRESLGVVPAIMQQRSYGFAASRTYYAMFYAAEAALLAKGLAFSRHSAVNAAFGQHFARTGLVPAELHRSLLDAFELRNLGDYSTDPFTREMAEGVLRDAHTFVEAVEGYLKSIDLA